MDTLAVSNTVQIPMSEIHMTAVRSQGAGGQNVNKVATAIHLRFDAASSIAVPEHLKRRLLSMSDHRITAEGVIIIKSQAHRSQDRNRQAALDRLRELLLNASQERKRRIKTKPSKNAKKRRLDEKNRRGTLKRTRQKVPNE